MSIIYCDAKRIGYNLYLIGYCDELMFEGYVEMFNGDNNEAELKAVQLALEKYPGADVIYTDSQYTVSRIDNEKVKYIPREQNQCDIYLRMNKYYKSAKQL